MNGERSETSLQYGKRIDSAVNLCIVIVGVVL